MFKLLPLLALLSAVDSLSFDGMDFLIYSRKHYKRHLVISGGRLYFNKDRLYEDAFWKFEESATYPGYYTLHNAQFANHFLEINPGSGLAHIRVTYETHERPNEYNLFRFYPMKDICPGCYLISAKTCGAMGCCLEVDPGNAEAVKANPNCYWNSGGPQYVGVFELKARYNPTISTTELDDIDLRGLSHGPGVPKEYALTYGMKTSLTRTEVHKTTTKAFFEASISAAVEELNIGAKYGVEFTHELTNSFKQTSAQYWERREKLSYTHQPGYRTKILQHILTFQSAMTLKTELELKCQILIAVRDEPGRGPCDGEEEFTINEVAPWGDYYHH